MSIKYVYPALLITINLFFDINLFFLQLILFKLMFQNVSNSDGSYFPQTTIYMELFIGELFSSIDIGEGVLG